MTEKDVNGDHLSQEELERFLPRLRGEGAEPGPDARRHLDACGRCRHELRQLEAVDQALAGLPRLEPSPGFTEAVMARVDLSVPWYRKAWSTLLERWLLVAALVGGATASAGGVAWALTLRPELTAGGLASFVLEQASALFWTAVVGAGRLLWTSGLAESIRALGAAVDPLEGLAALAVLSGCAATAGAVMLRLMDAVPPRLDAAGS